MTRPQLCEIITSAPPGAFYAFALDQDGQPWRSFVQFWPETETELRLGQTVKATLRADARDQGGYFLTSPSGQDVFLTPPKDVGLCLGQVLCLECVSEARQDKSARGVLVKTAGLDVSAYRAWRDSLLGDGMALPERSDPDTVMALRERLVMSRITLPGGGRLLIDRTRALTVMDIDSAGRRGKGSAGARALSLNQAAVVEAARQIALRDLGGLFVIDLVGPLNASSSQALREAFIATFQSVSPRQVICLKPSRLGLMEISIAWGACPADQRYYRSDGQETDIYTLLRQLERVERDMAMDPGRLYRLSLSQICYAAYLDNKTIIDRQMQERFSGRLEIARSQDGLSDEIVRR